MCTGRTIIDTCMLTTCVDNTSYYYRLRHRNTDTTPSHLTEALEGDRQSPETLVQCRHCRECGIMMSCSEGVGAGAHLGDGIERQEAQRGARERDEVSESRVTATE